MIYTKKKALLITINILLNTLRLDMQKIPFKLTHNIHF